MFRINAVVVIASKVDESNNMGSNVCVSIYRTSI